MSPPFLIIDGYNLLHAAGLARLHYGPGDLERARQRLLALLVEKFRSEERRRCTIVFDAHHAPADLPRRSEYHGLAVEFAPSGQDADSTIERMIAQHPAARRTIVVSSDHRLHQAAKRRNAKPVDSETFLEQLQRRESISPRVEDQVPTSTPPPPRPRPASDWSAEFGDIDVQALALEVGREPLAEGHRADPEISRLDELQQQLNDPAWLARWLDETLPPPP